MMCCPLQNDGDGPEFCSTSHPKAGKDHRCSECDGVIAKGTVHELAAGKWDGEMSQFRTCLLCVEIRNHFACGYTEPDRDDAASHEADRALTDPWREPEVISSSERRRRMLERYGEFEGGYGGWTYGEVWNQLEESFFPDMTCGGRCMQGLSPAAKDFLIERRLAWLFDSEIEIDGAPPPKELS